MDHGWAPHRRSANERALMELVHLQLQHLGETIWYQGSGSCGGPAAHPVQWAFTVHTAQCAFVLLSGQCPQPAEKVQPAANVGSNCSPNPTERRGRRGILVVIDEGAPSCTGNAIVFVQIWGLWRCSCRMFVYVFVPRTDAST
ncbi:unnamed protein product [Ostreobium quekettii]|uniref:Uncharacterized protein n=1 Tax=Ostreobium quekettii TaxID=121088 RepID=A0A8S1IV60_9CHLO|nr:unnamed protein product [Ostreobium quekettii]